jgi:molybdenum-dependent DNA-binding transcriptional regulator ModE
MSGSAMKNLRLFKSLCGRKAMLNIAIVTTMWGIVGEKVGSAREKDLRRDVWNDMVHDGCAIERFEDTYESAWDIVDRLDKVSQANVLLPRELLDDQLSLNETRVGATLSQELEKLIEDRQASARKYKRYAEDAVIKKEIEEIEKKIDQVAEELRRLRIPFGRRILLFFSRRSS